MKMRCTDCDAVFTKEDDSARCTGCGFGRTVPECTDELGHVFEVRGDPPYRCTFCNFTHEETVGGLFVRATAR
jgi:DNA-directed RNA polymerase subunit RPC12/RpoP